VGDDVAATEDDADLGLDWQTMTTSLFGTPDVPPVDMGVHDHP
jgi:hypothetical protein